MCGQGAAVQTQAQSPIVPPAAASPGGAGKTDPVDPGQPSAARFFSRADAAVRGRGGPLAPEVTNNVLGLDLTPKQEYLYHSHVAPRATAGAGSDLGALSVPLQAAPR